MWSLISLALGGVGRAIAQAFGWVTENTTHMLIAALVLVSGLAAYEKIQADDWHTTANKCAAARLADAQEAQRVHDQRVAQVKAIDAQQIQITKEHSDELQAQLDRAHMLADQYRQRMRRAATLVPPPAITSVSSTAAPAAALPDTSQLVTIPVTDFNTCTDASVMVPGWQSWYNDAKRSYDAAVAEIVATH